MNVQLLSWLEALLYIKVIVFWNFMLCIFCQVTFRSNFLKFHVITNFLCFYIKTYGYNNYYVLQYVNLEFCVGIFQTFNIIFLRIHENFHNLIFKLIFIKSNHEVRYRTTMPPGRGIPTIRGLGQGDFLKRQFQGPIRTYNSQMRNYKSIHELSTNFFSLELCN